MDPKFSRKVINIHSWHAKCTHEAAADEAKALEAESKKAAAEKPKETKPLKRPATTRPETSPRLAKGDSKGSEGDKGGKKKDVKKAAKLARKGQAKITKMGHAGESDRRIPSKRPKHLNTGKRGGGPADAIVEELELRQRACEMFSGSEKRHHGDLCRAQKRVRQPRAWAAAG